MKRTICLLVISVLLIFAFSPAVYAASGARLDDSAGLLSSSERADLTDRLNDVSNRYNVDIVIVTVSRLGGKSAMEYADDYFDNGGFGQSPLRGGVVLVISMAEREWWMSTGGFCITAFTDAGIEYIGEQISSDLSDGEYYDAFKTFVGLCDDFIVQADKGAPYDIGNMPHKPLSLIALPICLLLGVIIAAATVQHMKSELKTVRFKAEANSYIKKDSFRLTESRDMFLYRRVSRRLRPESSGSGRSGGGGSSVHVGSSGSRHGGGGGRF